jgi:plasmid rolling circle replication initiator protein Rep
MEYYKEFEAGKRQVSEIENFGSAVEMEFKSTGLPGIRKKIIIERTERDLEKLNFDYAEDSRFLTKSFQVASCMNYWDTKVYHINKKIELLRCFRCKDKFCTNCKRVRVSELLTQFMPDFVKYSEKYKPMLLTLTVPNVPGEQLRAEIDKMFKKFRRLQRFYSEKLGHKESYKERQYDVKGAIRALEVTYNKAMNTYHPHLHILLFIDDRAPADFWAKTIEGEWCNVKRQHNMISPADVEIRELWTRLYLDIDRRTKNIVTDDYICDIRLIKDDIKGILEVLKYSFKTRDIANFDVFFHLRGALHGRRLKQGYGCLYNLKFEDAEIPDTSDDLFDEIPEAVVIGMRKLITDFGEYEKVKRFTKMDWFHVIDQHLED